MPNIDVSEEGEGNFLVSEGILKGGSLAAIMTFRSYRFDLVFLSTTQPSFFHPSKLLFPPTPPPPPPTHTPGPLVLLPHHATRD